MDKDKFYIGEDGLEYCAVCQEPVEKYLPENVQEVFRISKRKMPRKRWKDWGF